MLAGHSGSCPVVRRVAIDNPERVAGLILEVSPLTLRDDPGLRGFIESVVSPLRDPISVDVARSVVRDTSSAGVAPELVDVLVDELRKVPARVWQGTFTGLLRYDDTAERSLVTAPILLVGDNDTLVSREVQIALARSSPGASLVVHPGAGHTPRWDNPSQFSHHVALFTDGVRRSRG